jgi:hypothetical protein
MTEQQIAQAMLDHFLSKYLRPFYDLTPTFDHETGEWFGHDKRYFEANPERDCFVRKSYGGEFSPIWDALFTNAFGVHTLAGVDWKFLELFRREPVRLVLVTRLTAKDHTRKVFYLGRADETWSFETDWGIPEHLALNSDTAANTFATEMQGRLQAEHAHCEAWLAELFEMLRADPTWNERQFFRSMTSKAVN